MFVVVEIAERWALQRALMMFSEKVEVIEDISI